MRPAHLAIGDDVQSRLDLAVHRIADRFIGEQVEFAQRVPFLLAEKRPGVRAVRSEHPREEPLHRLGTQQAPDRLRSRLAAERPFRGDRIVSSGASHCPAFPGLPAPRGHMLGAAWQGSVRARSAIRYECNILPRKSLDAPNSLPLTSPSLAKRRAIV